MPYLIIIPFAFCSVLTGGIASGDDNRPAAWRHSNVAELAADADVAGARLVYVDVGPDEWDRIVAGTEQLGRPAEQIREAGMQPAVTINPATPVSLLKDIINDVYMVLIMSVNPGFGGQKFIEHSLDKVRELRELITVTGSQALIEVDGGVNLETGSRLVEAGADVLVAGNAVFSAPDPKEAIRALRNL